MVLITNYKCPDAVLTALQHQLNRRSSKKNQADKRIHFSVIILILWVIEEWDDGSIIFISVVGNIEDDKNIIYSFKAFFCMKRWRHCLMLTIYKLDLTPRPVTKLIKMYRSRLYQKRPTWLVYLKTSSLSNRYQSEKKIVYLVSKTWKLTEDGNSLPVLAPCNLSSLFFNNYKHKRSVFNVKPRETRYLSV